GVDGSLKTAGLECALKDMLARRWRPTELLTNVQVGAPSAVDLSVPCLFTAGTSVQTERQVTPERQVTLRRSERGADGRLRVAAIGLGNWSTDTLLPILMKNPRV